MKKQITLFLLFSFYITHAQDNLWGGYYKILVDSTIVMTYKDVLKNHNKSSKNYMEQLITIDVANRLIKNTYCKVNSFLDFENYKVNQLEDKNLKKLFKKFKSEELCFIRVSAINFNDKYYIAIHLLTVDYFENNIRVRQKGCFAMATFKYNKERLDWEFEKFETSDWWKDSF